MCVIQNSGACKTNILRAFDYVEYVIASGRERNGICECNQNKSVCRQFSSAFDIRAANPLRLALADQYPNANRVGEFDKLWRKQCQENTTPLLEPRLHFVKNFFAGKLSGVHDVNRFTQ